MRLFARTTTGFVRVAQNTTYIMSLGYDKVLADAILKWLAPLERVKKSYMIRKLKENSEAVSREKSLIVQNPMYLDTIFPFDSKDRRSFSPEVAKVTQNYNERIWVAKLIETGRINPAEDLPKIRSLLSDFNNMNSGRKIEEFQDDSDLFKFVSDNKPEESIEMPYDGWRMIEEQNVDGTNVKLIEIYEKNAMEEIGKNSNWCVAHGSWGEYEPPFQCFVIAGQPKVLAHVPTEQIKNEQDEPLFANDVKYIRGLVEKHLDNPHAGDFAIYDDAAKQLGEVEKSLGNKDRMKELIEMDEKTVSLIPPEKIGENMQAILGVLKDIDFDTVDSRVAEQIGNYIDFYNLPEKEILKKYAVACAMKNKKTYLKQVPESFKSEESDLLFKINHNPQRRQDVIHELFNKAKTSEVALRTACLLLESNYFLYTHQSGWIDMFIDAMEPNAKKKVELSILKGMRTSLLRSMSAISEFGGLIKQKIKLDYPKEVADIFLEAAIKWVSDPFEMYSVNDTYYRYMQLIENHEQRVALTKAFLISTEKKRIGTNFEHSISIIPKDISADELHPEIDAVMERARDQGAESEGYMKTLALDSVKIDPNLYNKAERGPDANKSETEKAIDMARKKYPVELEQATVEGWKKWLSSPDGEEFRKYIPKQLLDKYPELQLQQVNASTNWYGKSGRNG
jgi:hypothetical protein